MTFSSNYTASLGRLMIAAIFLASGFQKILTPEQTQQYITAAGLPQPVAAYWAAVAIELIGGLALILGFGIRFAALVLAVFSLTAAAFFHTHFSDQNQVVNFLKNIAIAGGLLQVVAFGSGGASFSRNGYDSR